MTEQDFFNLAPGDVERAKKLWCASWAHIDCGGSPVAWVGPNNDLLGCTACKAVWPTNMKPLGEVILATGAFKSLIHRPPQRRETYCMARVNGKLCHARIDMDKRFCADCEKRMTAPQSSIAKCSHGFANLGNCPVCRGTL